MFVIDFIIDVVSVVVVVFVFAAVDAFVVFILAAVAAVASNEFIRLVKKHIIVAPFDSAFEI